MHEIPARLALIVALIVPVALSACSRTPHAAAKVGPERVEPAAALPSGLRQADGAATDADTGLPTRVVHAASGVTLVLIPAGEFRMGQSEAAHHRVIRNAFYLGETEVTNGQFRRFVEETGYRTDAESGVEVDGHTKGSFATAPPGAATDPREWSKEASWRTPFPGLGNPAPVDEHPVVHVSWNDATAFAAHFRMRLPTEAEWEYAAWAGAKTTYPWGDDPAAGAGYANLADLSHEKKFPWANVLFPFDDGAATLSPVGAYKPNAWGLKDMIGNLEEWAQDTYAEYPADGADESPVMGDGLRVIRGRSWLDGPGMSRAALQRAARRDFIGFRVAISVQPMTHLRQRGRPAEPVAAPDPAGM
ncbi:MAG: SUMF1/EgtB/PvdO family nonheme iron enzyme [Acidobacteria bacterium]|nr:SUMF1/EgtB/PvdO family nonheme iron enzyme [Acidobacteriota bacterium]